MVAVFLKVAAPTAVVLIPARISFGVAAARPAMS
jgi:hypothetical protein